MSVPDASENDRERESEGALSEEAEIVDGVPVLGGPPRIVPVPAAREQLPLERRSTAVMPAVQAAAVAAGGFVAGAAVVGLVHRRRQRSSALLKARRGRRGVSRGEGRAGDLLQIVGSRSLLLDVHLLGGGADGDR